MFKLKNSFAEWYQPHQCFVVRNPLFPVGLLHNWLTSSVTGEGNGQEFHLETLQAFYADPIAREAIYLASPDLYQQLLLWLDDTTGEQETKGKVKRSLLKYMIRMCTRCTPFGVFASCTSGVLADSTHIDLAGRNLLQRFARLDTSYVGSLYEHLLKKEEIRGQLRYFPNNSLYPVNGGWRYIEHREQGKKLRTYHVVEVQITPYLEKLLRSASKGGTPAALARIITDDDISTEEALDFVHELIDSQVLTCELELSVTGDEPLGRLLRRLETLEDSEVYRTQLNKIIHCLDEPPSQPDQQHTEYYRGIARHLDQMDVVAEHKTLIQVDSYRPATVSSLDKKVSNEVLKGLSLLHLLSKDGKASFADFKHAFINRYEQQWKPLAEVLDEETGIGYGKSAKEGFEDLLLPGKLLNGKAIPEASVKVNTNDFKWTMYEEALSGNKTEIVIEDRLIEKLAGKGISPNCLPDSFCTMVKIIASSPEEIDKGNYSLELHPPAGPSGANLLARFCHIHPGIRDFVTSIIKKEEEHHPDWIFAEIAHLPESAVGNILMRPTLRQYEIPYLSCSSVAEEFQIPITDLLVAVVEDEVVLYSKRLDKRIMPRLTTAHNFKDTTLPIYQFLCDLQYQQIRPVGWSWDALNSRPFLPRIRYDRFIISKARWVLSQDETAGFDLEEDEGLLVRFVQLRKTRSIPGLVLLVRDDNELLLHLGNISCLKLLLAELKKNKTVTLTESFDEPANCWIKSGAEQYNGEFILAFSKKPAEVPATVLLTMEPIGNVQRTFAPGSEWLYAKLYCGAKTAEGILLNYIKPLTEELLREQVIDKYFFVRYNDPAHHIRVRFHSGEKDSWMRVMNALQLKLATLLKDDCVYALQYDTYHRELERYGELFIEESETIFFHQSVVVLNCLALLDGDDSLELRRLVALRAIDLFLDDLNYSVHQKFTLIDALDKNFAAEFKLSTSERKAIGEKYNKSKQLIERVMEDAGSLNDDIAGAVAAFEVKEKSYRRAIRLVLVKNDLDVRGLESLLASYLHMLVNRMFITNQRETELLIYEFLYKYYSSRLKKDERGRVAIKRLTNSA
jgi:lantibiotic biosynthesis protein